MRCVCGEPKSTLTLRRVLVVLCLEITSHSEWSLICERDGLPVGRDPQLGRGGAHEMSLVSSVLVGLRVSGRRGKKLSTWWGKSSSEEYSSGISYRK